MGDITPIQLHRWPQKDHIKDIMYDQGGLTMLLRAVQQCHKNESNTNHVTYQSNHIACLFASAMLADTTKDLEAYAKQLLSCFERYKSKITDPHRSNETRKQLCRDYHRITRQLDVVIRQIPTDRRRFVREPRDKLTEAKDFIKHIMYNHGGFAVIFSAIQEYYEGNPDPDRAIQDSNNVAYLFATAMLADNPDDLRQSTKLIQNCHERYHSKIIKPQTQKTKQHDIRSEDFWSLWEQLHIAITTRIPSHYPNRWTRDKHRGIVH